MYFSNIYIIYILYIIYKSQFHIIINSIDLVTLINKILNMDNT